MKKKTVVNRIFTRVDWLCFLAVLFSVSAANAVVFKELNGIAIIEAEDFVSQEKDNIRKWYVTTLTQTPAIAPDLDSNSASSASGKAYVEILPDTRVTPNDLLIVGENFNNVAGAQAILNYKVLFSTTGKYHVWVRAHPVGPEDNSVHVGIDGTWPETGQRVQWCGGTGWYWSDGQRTEVEHCGVPGTITLDVATTGEHTFSLSMREDGTEIDKVIMVKADGYKPAGEGPPAVKVGDADPTCSDGILNQNEEYIDCGGVCPACTQVRPVTYQAATDFARIPATGDFVDYYVDETRGALAIDATVAANRGKFAAAKVLYTGVKGTYDFNLTGMQETDGETTYKVYVNGVQIGTDVKNDRITSSALDYNPQIHIFKGISLSPGDVIRVESNASSNGLIPEGAGFAWARGRWSQLKLIPSISTPVLSAKQSKTNAGLEIQSIAVRGDGSAVFSVSKASPDETLEYSIYSSLGVLIHQGSSKASIYAWNGKTKVGSPVNKGLYVLSVKANNTVRSMTFVK